MDNQEEFDCPICHEDNKDKENEEDNKDKENEEDRITYTTQCKHEFHITCLTSWYKIRRTCPYCRAPLIPIVGPNAEPYATVPTEAEMYARNLVQDYFDPANPQDNIAVAIIAINFLLTSNGAATLRFVT